jgi:hypothetical protein
MATIPILRGNEQRISPRYSILGLDALLNKLYNLVERRLGSPDGLVGA